MPRAGRDCVILSILISPNVSIHVPRAGRDRGCDARAATEICFNPRAPCGARP
nr:MAG TPA: hypothetical protein [Caudoviricetes sp.]